MVSRENEDPPVAEVFLGLMDLLDPKVRVEIQVLQVTQDRRDARATLDHLVFPDDRVLEVQLVCLVLQAKLVDQDLGDHQGLMANLASRDHRGSRVFQDPWDHQDP